MKPSMLESNSHVTFKKLALKSIGSSISVPHIPKILKNEFGEEKFKASVDKKVTALYLKLLQNRVSKLKKEEELERKKLEFEEKIRSDKLAKKKRKLELIEFQKKINHERKENLEFIREKIEKSKEEHRSLMNELKKKSNDFKKDLNKSRKIEKLNHIRIKSMFIETCRVENSKKAQKIREKIKELENSREEFKVLFKSDLRKKYLGHIESEKQQKAMYETQIKDLESQESTLLQKLGRSHSTTIQSI